MTTYPNIGLTLPTRGPTGSGHWADTDDANTALLDAHNHQNGKGLPINSAALAIDGDVSFSSLWAVTNMQRVSFAAVTALSANNKSIFVSSADNELYWRTNTGANVKLTSGSTLNVGAFVGGIGGDYTSVGAQLNFDDGGKRYTLKEGTADSNGWAKIACGGIRLAEFNTTETLYVEQLAPAALAGTYTMTWPTALPANAQAVQIDNAGQFSFSNTFAQLVTFTLGATAAANQHITVSGTGEFKHGTRTVSFTGTQFIVQSGTAVYTTAGDISSTAACVLIAAIPLHVGERITAITATFDSGTGTVDVTDFHVDKIVANGTATSLGSTTVSNIGTPTTTTIDLTDTTLAANESFIVSVSINATGCNIRNVNVSYTHP